MTLAIMQPYFFPYIGYWQLINAVDTFIIYDNIQFSKKGWFHRNNILLNGKKTLFSIPLKKDSDSLDVVDKIVKEKKNIKGLELNIRNHYEDINNFYRVLNNNKLNLIKGSDSHDASLQFYEDMEYFKIDTKDLIKILNS